MATPDTTIVLDDYSLQIEGDVDIVSTGSDKQVTLQASGSGSSIHIEADDHVCLTASGAAVVTVDSSKKQATVQGLESVKIGVGPPLEMGAVIDLTATGITLSLAKVITITMSPTGVEIKAAETSLKIGVEGITLSGPLLQAKGEAAHKLTTTIEQQQTSATRQFSAGVDMIGG
jgi:hypothetical protein